MNKTQTFRTAVGMVAAASMLLAGTAFAATAKEVKAPGAFSGKVHSVAAKTADHIAGKVTAVNGTSFSVTTAGHKDKKTGAAIAGTVYTVNTTDATTFSMAKSAAKLSDVTVGETVLASGALDKTTSMIAATSVKITPAIVKKAAVAEKKETAKVKMMKKTETPKTTK